MEHLRVVAAAVCLLGALLQIGARAPAYLNPGTGSYLVQILLAGLLGSLLAIRIFWHRIKAAIKGLSARRPDASGEQPREG